MKVACEHCSAEYEVEESEITGRGVRITCPSCSHVFVVYHTPKESSFEIDMDIELDDNGELSMDLDAMLNSIIDETAVESEKIATKNSASPEVQVAEEKAEKSDEIDFEIDVDFNEVLQDAAPQSSKPQPSKDIGSVESASSSQTNDVDSETERVESDTNKEVVTEDVVTEEQLSAMDVYSLNFASVGIKSWKVKKPIGLMFEYSDYKTFQKSLSDGRISSGDQISPDGKNWTPMSEVEDFEVFFCKTYLEFERKEAVPEVKTVKEKVIPSLGGTNELASALAAAQAEVEQANRPNTVRKPAPKRPKRKPKPQQKSEPETLGLDWLGRQL